MDDKKEKGCRNCDHFSGGTNPKCNAPMPFWFDTALKATVYGSQGDDCETFKRRYE